MMSLSFSAWIENDRLWRNCPLSLPPQSGASIPFVYGYRSEGVRAERKFPSPDIEFL
jgi:hypothetical protein